MIKGPIIFCGGRKRGAKCLQWLIEQKHEIPHVFCLQEYSHEIIYYEKIETVAEKAGIPFTVYNKSVSQMLYDIVGRAKPRVIMAIGWRMLLKDDLLALSQNGGYAIHDSLLPLYRGWAPTTWAVINGENQGGATLFKLSAAMDAGLVIGQQSFQIGCNEYIDQIFDKIDSAALNLVKNHIDDLLAGTAKGHEQDWTLATYGCQRIPEDGGICWDWTSQRILNWVRALSRPNPGAFSFLDGKKIFIWKARPNPSPRRYIGSIPGAVVDIHPDNGVEILTGDGGIFVTEVQYEGKPPQNAAEVIFSYRMRLKNQYHA